MGFMGSLDGAIRAVNMQMIVFSVIMLWLVPLFLGYSPWLLLAYPITGVIPFIVHYGLHKVQTGWITPESARRKRNSFFSFNVPLVSVFNIILTASQGVIQIGVAIYWKRISPKMVPHDPSSFTSWLVVAWHVFIMLLSADVANFFFHRASHTNKWLWHNMHRMHHEHAEVEHAVFSLFYVNPVEMILSNICFFCGIYICKSDLITVMIFATCSTVLVCAGHSGLVLPLLNVLVDPSFHRLHHSRNRCNYCEHFTIMDKLFGTYLAM